MPESTSDKPQYDPEPPHQQLRTERQDSIRHLGVTGNTLRVEYSYPDYGRQTDPAFPEENALEIESGLVHEQTLDQIRLQACIATERRRRPSQRDLEKAPAESTEFVTFKINDPDHPHNWSRLFRWYITLVALTVVVCVAYGSSIVTDGLGLIEGKYNISLEVAILSHLLYHGLWLRSRAAILVSSIRDYRSATCLYYLLRALHFAQYPLCSFAQYLLASRFLCGVFSSSGLSLAGGTIADIWNFEERGMAIAFFAAAPYCGPEVGPIVTGWINVGSHRLGLFFWVTMAFSGAMLILIRLISETYTPVILKRAAKIRKETGNQNIVTEQRSINLRSAKSLRRV